MKLPLTISLLASSRTATLERCLDSLKPLLLEVPAELIVVFTGTDERVRQIAERYTDQVIPFTWCNDFSAARNEGIRRACGAFISFIDSDDYISSDFLEMTACAKYQDKDLLLFDFEGSGENAAEDAVTEDSDFSVIYYGKEDMHELIRRILVPEKLIKDGNTDFRTPCARAYRKSVIEQ